MAVGAYPFAAWPRVSREYVALLRGVLRGLPAAPPALTELAEALLGTALALAPRAAELRGAHAAPTGLAAGSCLLVLQRAFDSQRVTFGCELDPALVSVLVDRVLGGDGHVVPALGAALDPLASGALGYFAARLCAKAEAGFTLHAVVDDPAELGTLLSELFAKEPLLCVPYELTLGGERAGQLRLLIPESSARGFARSAASERHILPGLSALPITLCAHAASLPLPRSELESLAAGDILVPARCRVARGAAGFEGELELHAAGSKHPLCVCVTRGRELVLGTINPSEDLAMTEGKRIPTQALDEVASLAGDAPVTLCLELARFTLTLDELSQLRAGEILNTGRAIGQHAQLTAGGVPLARGELVEVDGEIGLRVLELLRSR